MTGVLMDPQTSGTGGAVRIHSIQAEGTRFTVNYCPMSSDCIDTATQVLQLREENLHLLRLRVSLPADDGGPERAATFEVTVTPRLGASTRVRGYDVRYREVTGPWRPHCDLKGVIASDRDATSFLPRLRINSVNAAVESVPTWTTIGCGSGAIVTCLDWGYVPWNPDTGVYDPLRSHLFGSCLQAKRAAYFVGRGDLKSYTRNGTRINKRDQFGLGRNANGQVEELRTLEALWSPQGAVCLNPENRRVPDIALPTGMRGVPPCARPPRWTPTGKLATGTFTPAPD
ncbi:ADYC domain-containing protein [Myxococcus dinghuensis]|uniref:ADYC domain-containing protein n=1 Tax=Myxococcus dinghuensis TaxID=2906761 RepID=UPI0020A6E485|nr:ADYC domain-containing protein [Myxococcus dinghuensis]